MAQVTNQPTIQDFEDALRSTVDQLHLMYQHNGGEATKKTVMQLLKNIDRLSPWLEDMSKNYPEFKEILGQLREEKGNGNGKES